MKILRCSKPGCGNTYDENAPEFTDGFCACGAALIEVEEVSIKSVDEIINDDSTTPRFEYELDKEESTEVEEKQQTEEEPIVKTHVDPLLAEMPTTIVSDDFEDASTDDVQEQLEDEATADNTQAEVEAIADNTELADGLANYLIGKNNEIVFKQDAAYDAVYKNLQEQGYFGDPYGDYTGDRIELMLEGRVFRTYPLEYDEMLIGREHDGVIPEIDYTTIDSERYISRRHALIYRQQNEYFIRNLSTKNSLHVNKEVVLEKEFRCLQDDDKIALSRKYGLVFKKKSERE